MANRTRATPKTIVDESQKIFKWIKKISKIIAWLIIITIVAIVVMGWLKKKFAEWEKEKLSSLGTGQQNSLYTQTEKGSVVKVVDTSDLICYKVKAVWGERVKIGTPSGFKWVEHDWDPAYASIGNGGRLYWIRLNEDNSQTATEGLLNRKMTKASFSKPAQRIEFTSLCILSDKYGNPILDERRQTTRLPVYLIVEYTK